LESSGRNTIILSYFNLNDIITIIAIIIIKDFFLQYFYSI